jgi:hypothetical protein
MDPFHPIWTRFGRQILFNPRNKLTEEFFTYRKIQDGRRSAITANYEIGNKLKSIQDRDPIFFPRPMFSRVRKAMKLSFPFYDHSNYLKIQNGRHLGQKMHLFAMRYTFVFY